MQQNAIAILGGTFDPIHNGHLYVASKLLTHLPIDEVCFVPCRGPVLKSATQATAQQRLTMLKLALANQPNFTIDTCELERPTPSYTVDTLTELSKSYPNRSLCFVMGMDAFISLPHWHHWRRLPELAHLIIINRPEYVRPKSQVLTQLLKAREISQATRVLEKPAGFILCLDLKPYPISSTQIRQLIAAGKEPIGLIPEDVWKYIQQSKLYL